ncbi:DUF4058 family protein [Dolichospermum lemmermannii CS-548]|jgi:Protein of unknown function (DUF4058)|uniref:DUF4058 family protein n=1 Tax=Dolichospermum lemmermannii TaxID=54295 RepID=UPI0023303D05|nr:DUF4058 family protein [Dolichospermum lemmermannii]MDB9438822.1 DUF4058 family protein [Dolichospermum lemmermannii CS-548]
MPSPFPGMNPYLENPELWPEVHHWILTLLAESLIPQLRPKYRVAVEKRVYHDTDRNSVLIGIPDVTIARSLKPTTQKSSNIAVVSPPVKPVTVNIPIPEEIRETYLEVREVATGEVITVIELLSPKNKRQGEGRKAYQTKRLQILGSSTHLVEIDLLRAGESMPILDNNIKSDYQILVSRSQLRPRAELYPFNLSEAIPAFFLPLQKEDIEPLVDLQNVIQDLFDRAGLDLAIDYNSEPVPPIQETDLIWVNKLLKEQDL